MAAIRAFLFEFGTLFAIINPYGLAFVFLNRTMSLSDQERGTIARQVAIYAFCVLAVSYFGGTIILEFFGVTLPALRIAGGLVVSASGWTMLNQDPNTDGPRTASTNSFDAIRREAFFPLTIPLTTGPGTIATAITLAASSSPSGDRFFPRLVSLVAAFVIGATIYHAYARVSRLARFDGVEGTLVITRLSAFLLLCVGVQITISGVTDVLVPLFNGR